MSPRIMSHQYTISDSDREFIRKKIDRLRKFFDRITEVSVILDSAKHQHVAEILLFGPQLNLHVKGEAEDMRTAFETAVNKAERNLNKAKTKRWGDKKHKRHTVTIRRFPAEEMEVVPITAEKAAALVEPLPTEHLEPKLMSLMEARKIMEKQGRGLLVFVNPETESVNILHRNSSDHIELVKLG